ncbi:MAG: ATP-dependent DNA helicase RecG, partial [Bacteroidales bacterium]|nr:ATP-dependent DNA helicase RecG [Bacteroidales bacterium]
MLDTSIEFLKGVGPKRAEVLRKEFNVFTYNDMLNYYPFKYVDKSKFYTCREAIGCINTYVQVKGRITGIKILGEHRKKRLVARLADESGVMELVWFNNLKYWEETLKKNTVYVVFGKPSLFNDTLNISHPEIRLEEDASKDTIAFQPFYNTSEKAKKNGLDSLKFSKLCFQLLQEVTNRIPETLPNYLVEKLHFIDRKTALINIHFPQNSQILQQAIHRLKFEEIFFMQLLVLSLKESVMEANNGYMMPKVGQYFHQFYQQNLSFPLT